MRRDSIAPGGAAGPLYIQNLLSSALTVEAPRTQSWARPSLPPPYTCFMSLQSFGFESPHWLARDQEQSRSPSSQKRLSRLPQSLPPLPGSFFRFQAAPKATVRSVVLGKIQAGSCVGDDDRFLAVHSKGNLTAQLGCQPDCVYVWGH